MTKKENEAAFINPSLITDKSIDIITYNDIIGISSNGFTYNKNNEIKNVDFYECRLNWVEYVNTSNDFKRNDLTVENTKCVADRDAFANPRYFLFYSNQRVLVQFPPERSLLKRILRQSDRQTYYQFRELQEKLYSYDLTSFDLG